MGYYCNICKKDITKGIYSYSMDKFGRALCREHQEIERSTQEKSFRIERLDDSRAQKKSGETNTEENLASDEVSVEDATKTGWISLGKKVVVKMGKGVVKGAKKISTSSKKYIQNRKWKGVILCKMTMSQLEQLCVEKEVSTKKSVLRDVEDSYEDYWEEVDCTQDDLVSRLRNRVSLDDIISFAKRNKIDIKDILVNIKRKKEGWEKKENTETGEEMDLSPKHNWRIAVLTRDKHTCRVCGKVGNSAHHIYSRTYCQEINNLELEWDTRNGITACYECHQKITSDGRKWFDGRKCFEENEKYYKNG